MLKRFMLETKLGAIQQKARWYIFLKSRCSHVTPILPAHNILKIDQIICQEGHYKKRKCTFVRYFRIQEI